MTREEALALLIRAPAQVARWCGYPLLRDELHGQWIRGMMHGSTDMTLLAHRGSYKTTCLAMAMASSPLRRSTPRPAGAAGVAIATMVSAIGHLLVVIVVLYHKPRFESIGDVRLRWRATAPSDIQMWENGVSHSRGATGSNCGKHSLGVAPVGR